MYTRVLWFGGINVLVFLIVGVFALITFLEQREALIHLHESSANQTRALVEQRLADVQAGLRLAAAQDEANTADGLARVLAAYPAIRALDWVGPDGVSVHVPEAVAGHDWQGAEAFAVAAGGDPFAGPSADDPGEWVIAVPASGTVAATGAETGAALIARVDAAVLFASAVSVPVGDQGYVVVVSAAGTVLASPPTVMVSEDIDPARFAVFEETRAGGSALRVYRGVENGFVIGRAAAWPALRMTAIVETPVGEFTPVVLRIIGVWALAAFLGVAIGEWVVRRTLHAITYPLGILRQAAHAVTQRDYRYRVRMRAHTVREFTTFEPVFNAMFSVLSSNQRELDAYATEMAEIVDQRARQLSRTVVQLERATGVMRTVAQIREPHALIARVTALIEEQFGVYHAEIWLVDDEHAALTLASGIGGEQAQLSFHEATRSVLVEVVTSGEVLYVPDITGEPRYRRAPSRAASRSALVLPLVVDNVLGVLNLESEHREAFAQDHIDVLRRLADEIAVALYNAQAFDVLERANSDLAQATLQANQANTLKSRFLYNASQKLHMPLNSLVSSAETLLSGVTVDLPPQVQERQRTIISNGRVIQGLVEDMLDLSAIEAGHMLLNLVWVTLPPLLEEITNAARALHMTAYASHRLDIRLDLMHLTEPLPPVWADADRLRYILINLMSNAVKFTESGDVVLSADTDGEDIWITVRDTGPGISDNELRYLFEPFQQQKAPVIDHARGAGLGLAVARLLAMRHGGDLTVETRRDEGTTFTLRLQCQPGGAPPRP